MYKYIPLNRKFGWSDLIVFAFLAIVLYAFIGVAHQWTGQFKSHTIIDLSGWSLPKYAFLSLVRAIVGYGISFVFTIIYGYIAAKLKRSETILIPFLDILQSIPVFGFLPGLVIGLMSIFPNSNLGLEIACAIMLATGQAWNMTFSFYYSVKNVPSELNEAGTMMKLSWLQRLTKIELPFSAVGLAWNSVMSMAGGWFFLTVCESFTLEDKTFHLPGIGSYMALAIEKGNRSAMIAGVITMFVLILFVDFVIWRPVLAWVQKFQMEEILEEEATEMPFVTSLLKDSILVNFVRSFQNRMKREMRFRKAKNIKLSRNQSIYELIIKPLPVYIEKNLNILKLFFEKNSDRIVDIIAKSVLPISVILILWGATRIWELIRTLDSAAWAQIWRSVGFTGVRVFGAVILSTLWTVPFGILVGLSPKLTRIFQPIVQLAASFPAPMLYPIVLTIMIHLGLGIRWGSMFLMLFGVQWYILFNVLAGASSISRELKDSMRMVGANRLTLWKKLYLPAVFPYLSTGWVNAAGGAWNACIVAEYLQYNGETLSAPGVGAMICRATNAADFSKLAGCLIAMVVTVVLLNRVLWNRICAFAEDRYR